VRVVGPLAPYPHVTQCSWSLPNPFPPLNFVAMNEEEKCKGEEIKKIKLGEGGRRRN
jgi:hypothetical protein